MKFIAVALAIILNASVGLALNPLRTYKQRPERYNMQYKEVKVKTNDGRAELNAWIFPAKNGSQSQVILIAHNGEGNMADYLRRVDGFTSMGYQVVIFDYRGFGESSEFEIDNNMYIYPHFIDDFESMLDYCRKAIAPQFDVYGWGIGGGLALGVGYHRLELKHVVSDSPFLAMEALEEKFSEWDEPMEVPFAGYDKKYEPLFALDNTPGKNLKGVLLMIGDNDILVSLDDMKALQKKSKKLISKDVFVVSNPDRKDNFRIDRKAYIDAIKAFLNN